MSSLLNQNELSFKQGDDVAFVALSANRLSINIQNGFNHQDAYIEFTEESTKKVIKLLTGEQNATV